MKHPSVEEVRAYCLERDNGIDAENFFDYYSSVGWVVGKSRKPMKDWMAAVRTWERNSPKKQSVIAKMTDTSWADMPLLH
jgi:archaellum component FlaD/FlaE